MSVLCTGLPLGPTGGVEFLVSLLQLRSLSLQRTQLGSEHAQHLSALTALTSLSLAW